EHVDVAIGDRVFDEVGRALVIEAHAGDLDVDAPHLAAAIRLWREVIDVIARQLAGERYAQAELELRVLARYEVKLERADLVVALGLDDDRLLAQPIELHEVRERLRAVGLAAGALGDRGNVERVVE